MPSTTGIGGTAEVWLRGWLLILAAGAALYFRRSIQDQGMMGQLVVVEPGEEPLLHRH